MRLKSVVTNNKCINITSLNRIISLKMFSGWQQLIALKLLRHCFHGNICDVISLNDTAITFAAFDGE